MSDITMLTEIERKTYKEKYLRIVDNYDYRGIKK